MIGPRVMLGVIELVTRCYRFGAYLQPGKHQSMVFNIFIPSENKPVIFLRYCYQRLFVNALIKKT